MRNLRALRHDLIFYKVDRYHILKHRIHRISRKIKNTYVAL